MHLRYTYWCNCLFLFNKTIFCARVEIRTLINFCGELFACWTGCVNQSREVAVVIFVTVCRVFHVSFSNAVGLAVVAVVETFVGLSLADSCLVVVVDIWTNAGYCNCITSSEANEVLAALCRVGCCVVWCADEHLARVAQSVAKAGVGPRDRVASRLVVDVLKVISLIAAHGIRCVKLACSSN